MSFRFNLFLSFLIFCLTFFSCQKKESPKETIIQQKHKHPYAQKKTYTYDTHGVSLLDEYQWMEDKENPAVLEYLKEENRYLDSIMQNTKELQIKIYQELLERTTSEIIYLKKIENNEYYSIKNKSQRYPVFYKKSAQNSTNEKIIFDLNQYVSNDQDLSIAFLEVSPDQQYFAFAIKQDQEEEYMLIINNINNNEISDTIPGVSTSAAWAEDSQTIFYTTKDETGRTDKVFNHKINLPYEEDKLEFYEEDPEFNVSVFKSKDNRYLLIQSESSTSSETHFLTVDDPNQSFKLFSPRIPDFKYEVFPHLNNFYLLVNERKNMNLQFMKATEGATDVKNWQPAEVYNENQYIRNIDVFKNFLVLYKSENGKPFIEIKDFKNNTSEVLLFDEEIFTIKPVHSTSFNDDVFQYEYESLLTPPSIFQVDFQSKQKELLYSNDISDFDKDSFITERKFIKSDDGIQIPVSLVYHKEIKKDGSSPLILYGYGAEKNHPFPAQSSSMNHSNRISLLNRGFIFAIAHVRGSKDWGADWNQKGIGMTKKNAVNDYLDCAEFLIDQGYTNHEKLIAYGEETGAVLAASAVNVQPDLFKLIVVTDPKTDLLRIIETEEKNKIKEEFGNPEDEVVFNYLLTYSPYDNIEVKAYPNFFINSTFHNAGIPYYEAAKWAARLREYNTSQDILLLNTEFNARTTLSERLKNVALEYAFVLEQLGFISVKKALAEKIP